VAPRPDGLSIGEVSELVGVPVPTLRSWQLRYGVAAPARTPGGHRRYAQADVEVLQAMRAAVGRGVAAGTAAQVLHEPPANPAVPLALLTEALDRVAAHDQDGLTSLLDRAEQVMGAEQTVHRLLLPALHEVGDRWERGELGVAAEHLATEAGRRWIARRTGTTPVRTRAAPVVLAAAPENRHTVALEAFGMLLHCRGWPTRLLGADTPVPALVKAVEATRAQAVVVTAHQVSRRRRAAEALAALRRHPVRLWFAGAAFDSVRHRRDVAGSYLGSVLPDAADAVAATLAAHVPALVEGRDGAAGP
jgi:DNA-binding transcriptional MerR regulator